MMDTDDSKEVDLEEFQQFWLTHVLPHLWAEVMSTPDFLRDDYDDESPANEPPAAAPLTRFRAARAAHTPSRCAHSVQ